MFLPLQQKDAANRQIVIIRTAAHDPSKHKQTDVFKIGRMILDYIVSADELMSVYGIRAIFGELESRLFGQTMKVLQVHI